MAANAQQRHEQADEAYERVTTLLLDLIDCGYPTAYPFHIAAINAATVAAEANAAALGVSA